MKASDVYAWCDRCDSRVYLDGEVAVAVNAHDELVAALEVLLRVADTIPWVAEEVPEGLAPMFYGTLTADGDRKIHDQYVAARALLARIKGEPK